MCYSVRIRSRLKELAAELGVRIDLPAFEELLFARVGNPELKIPYGIDLYFLLSQDSSEARLAPLVKRFHEEEKERKRATLAETEKELQELASGKATAAVKKKIETRERRREKLLREIAAPLERLDPLADRVFPFSYAPVVVEEQGTRWLRPMRYRVLPANGVEIPAKYNVFNARRDSLETAATWKPLFGRRHAIFPFVSFYEWVEAPGGGSREIVFHPGERAFMWAASLYSVTGSRLSFALITDEPPPEVAAAGHDRCPLFLEGEAWDQWLKPGADKKALHALLDRKEPVKYQAKSVVA